MKERLQKVLSQYGYGSRRACEKIIAESRVSINGQVAILGSKADPFEDQIKIDGNLLKPKKRNEIYIAFYKPRGVLSEIIKKDNRPIVRDYLPIKEHIFIVGRLDKESEGLILLTNNGKVANLLTHPRYEHEKEYEVLLGKIPDEDQISAWQKGVVLENRKKTLPVRIEILRHQNNNCWVKVTMREGKKRQIREICNLIGLPVKRIIRKRIACIRLNNLKPGHWRNLSKNEVRDLKSEIKLY